MRYATLSHFVFFFRETEVEQKDKEDRALFGPDLERTCICEVPGQVPCPGFVALPKEMTGKYQAALRRGEIEED